MNNQATAYSLATHRQSRIYAALAVLALPVILAILPGRYQLVPLWVPFVAAAVLAIPMVAAGMAPGSLFWRRAERTTAAVILPVGALMEFVLLALLLRDMARAHSGISGLTLLTTSIAIWTQNILIFALAYWQIDRGGPAGRVSGWQGRTDFSFPRGDPEDNVPADWLPVFADYLSLAFNTSAAFSPTDVLPLRPRAKMMMMLQSIISLITVIAVGARAINILGS
ncbi:MAG TPA: hypothetical protein VHS56_12120 [Candidatus Cybelea sp.]|jgi:hypothetical protein|nr:hypothetical protein [Candidatus Cybelea sp.]